VADRLVGRRAELPAQRPGGIKARHSARETSWPRPRRSSSARSAPSSPAT
jgi:hypothetical protein